MNQGSLGIETNIGRSEVIDDPHHKPSNPDPGRFGGMGSKELQEVSVYVQEYRILGLCDPLGPRDPEEGVRPVNRNAHPV